MNLLEYWMNLKEAYRYVIMIGGIVMMLLFGVTMYYFVSKESKVEEKEVLFHTPEVTKQDSKIQIDIKGAVASPGVYELNQDSNVLDAITKSGGLTEQADTTYINLSKRLKDEMVIVIYTKEEIAAMKEGKENVVIVEGKCVCPNITNDGCVKGKDKVDNAGGNNQKEDDGIINLNTATLEQLQTLTGIGEKKAKDIIAYREQNGAFKTIQELTEVKGIGSATFEKIKDRITVS